MSLALSFDSLLGEYISFNDGAGVTCSAGWGWGLSPGTPETQADRDAYEACNTLWLAAPNPRGPGAKYIFEEYSDYGGVAINRYEYVGPNTCP